MNLYRLHDRLYIRPHTRKLNSSAVLSVLSLHDVRLIMNVALIDDPALAAACRTVGMAYCHEPLNDSGAKLVPQRIRAIAREVAKTMSFGAVMINCDSGWNRSALVAVLAMYYFTNRPMADLIAEARIARGTKLLKNRAFEDFLLEEENDQLWR